MVMANRRRRRPFGPIGITSAGCQGPVGVVGRREDGISTDITEHVPVPVPPQMAMKFFSSLVVTRSGVMLSAMVKVVSGGGRR